MPRKGRPRRNARKLSENSKAKLAKIGDDVSSPDLEQCLKDFDAQVEMVSKQYLRNFKRELSKLLKDIRTQRISIPKVLQEMSLYEFQRRGNTVLAVSESLKQEKLGVADSGAKACPEAPPPPADENADPNHDPNPDLVTPARSTRSRRVKGTVPTTTTTTTRTLRATRQRTLRKPQPKEELDVAIHSKATGSPVDGGALLDAHLTDTMDDIVDRLTAVLPRCHRAKVMRTIKQMKSEMLTTARDITVTPAVIR